MANTSSEQIYLYVKYLTAHIARVREAMRRFINRGGVDFLISEYSSIGDKAEFIAELNSRADAHDRSKWQIDEFFPYLYHFYPENGIIPEEGKDPDFDRAVNLHYMRNDHHDRYWRINGREINDMTDGAICEMLCDWVSMSVYSNNSPTEWYNDNKDDVLKGMSLSGLGKISGLLSNFFEPIYLELQQEVSEKC